MADVLISIRKEWCDLISAGKKTVEVRKTVPKKNTPLRVFIYESRDGGGAGMVIGRFTCDKLIWVISHPTIFAGHPLLHAKAIADACMTQDEAEAYSDGQDLYGWHISDLVLFDDPKPLSAFHKPCPNSLFCESCGMFNQHPEPGYCGNAALQIQRPPQSWQYVEVHE